MSTVSKSKSQSANRSSNSKPSHSTKKKSSSGRKESKKNNKENKDEKTKKKKALIILSDSDDDDENQSSRSEGSGSESDPDGESSSDSENKENESRNDNKQIKKVKKTLKKSTPKKDTSKRGVSKVAKVVTSKKNSDPVNTIPPTSSSSSPSSSPSTSSSSPSIVVSSPTTNTSSILPLRDTELKEIEKKLLLTSSLKKRIVDYIGGMPKSILSAFGVSPKSLSSITWNQDWFGRTGLLFILGPETKMMDYGEIYVSARSRGVFVHPTVNGGQVELSKLFIGAGTSFQFILAHFIWCLDEFSMIRSEMSLPSFNQLQALIHNIVLWVKRYVMYLAFVPVPSFNPSIVIQELQHFLDWFKTHGVEAMKNPYLPYLIRLNFIHAVVAFVACQAGWIRNNQRLKEQLTTKMSIFHDDKSFIQKRAALVNDDIESMIHVIKSILGECFQLSNFNERDRALEKQYLMSSGTSSFVLDVFLPLVLFDLIHYEFIYSSITGEVCLSKTSDITIHVLFDGDSVRRDQALEFYAIYSFKKHRAQLPSILASVATFPSPSLPPLPPLPPLPLPSVSSLVSISSLGPVVPIPTQSTSTSLSSSSSSSSTSSSSSSTSSSSTSSTLETKNKGEKRKAEDPPQKGDLGEKKVKIINDVKDGKDGKDSKSDKKKKEKVNNKTEKNKMDTSEDVSEDDKDGELKKKQKKLAKKAKEEEKAKKKKEKKEKKEKKDKKIDKKMGEQINIMDVEDEKIGVTSTAVASTPVLPLASVVLTSSTSISSSSSSTLSSLQSSFSTPSPPTSSSIQSSAQEKIIVQPIQQPTTVVTTKGWAPSPIVRNPTRPDLIQKDTIIPLTIARQKSLYRQLDKLQKNGSSFDILPVIMPAILVPIEEVNRLNSDAPELIEANPCLQFNIALSSLLTSSSSLSSSSSSNGVLSSYNLIQPKPNIILQYYNTVLRPLIDQLKIWVKDYMIGTRKTFSFKFLVDSDNGGNGCSINSELQEKFTTIPNFDEWLASIKSKEEEMDQLTDTLLMGLKESKLCLVNHFKNALLVYTHHDAFILKSLQDYAHVSRIIDDENKNASSQMENFILNKTQPDSQSRQYCDPLCNKMDVYSPSDLHSFASHIINEKKKCGNRDNKEESKSASSIPDDATRSSTFNQPFKLLSLDLKDDEERLAVVQSAMYFIAPHIMDIQNRLHTWLSHEKNQHELSQINMQFQSIMK